MGRPNRIAIDDDRLWPLLKRWTRRNREDIKYWAGTILTSLAVITAVWVAHTIVKACQGDGVCSSPSYQRYLPP